MPGGMGDSRQHGGGMNVEQAVFLVGGLGTRLHKLTGGTAKPVLDVGGRPFLDHLLDEASRHGLKRALLPFVALVTVLSCGAPEPAPSGAAGSRSEAIIGGTNDTGDPSVVLAYTSAHGERGFPGKLDARITYRVIGPAELAVIFEATADRAPRSRSDV